MIDERKLNFELSKLISSYNNLSNDQFKIIFNDFIDNYYYYALEKIETEMIKENIVLYTNIIHTFNIFSSLTAFEDDYDTILKVFASRKSYPDMLEIIYNEKYISHTALALKLNKSSQALSDYVKKIPRLGLFKKIDAKGTIYALTEKGIRFWKKYSKNHLNEEIKRIQNKLSWFEEIIEHQNMKQTSPKSVKQLYFGNNENITFHNLVSNKRKELNNYERFTS